MGKILSVVNHILIGILVVVVLLCGAIVFYALRSPQDKTNEDEKVTNISISENAADFTDTNTNENEITEINDYQAETVEANTAITDDYDKNEATGIAKFDPALLNNSDYNSQFDYSLVPAYRDFPYEVINNNQPFFTKDEMVVFPFETYSQLDRLGRCGKAYANICMELMPTEERGPIGHIKPSGWHTVKYNDLIDGNYLYNRCHLIGYLLAGENDNECNLITGTRYLNIEGMLDFENKVANYVKNTGCHVLYRVTPVFVANELVARGVLMEGYSVEDDGQGICFNVFCYNVQPGIIIDYSTGDSCRPDGTTGYWDYSDEQTENANLDIDEQEQQSETDFYANSSEADLSSEQQKPVEYRFIVNKKTGKIHYPECTSVDDMKEENKWYYNGTISELAGKATESGKEYSSCGRCHAADW